MRRALVAMCVIVLIAVVYLSLSLVVLSPPRANFVEWFSLAAVLSAQAGLTLIAVSRRSPTARLRAVVVAGALILFGIAARRVNATLRSPHFEGDNLLLAAMLVAQAALTMIVEGRAAISHDLHTSD